MSRYLTAGVLVFFVFIFAFTLGATLNERQTKLTASTHCQKAGGVWTQTNYCQKIVSVCEPQPL